MKGFHKRGGGQSVFILLFRNLKAQNGIFWARIECLDVSDNVCVVEVQFLINTLVNWLELPPHPLLLFVKLSWFLIMASRETNNFDQDRKCSSTLFKKTFQNLSINNSCDVGKCSTEYLLRSVKNLLS